MKITKQQIEAAKRVEIGSYLTANGREMQKESSISATFFSPFRQEKTPSFLVNKVKNTYQDFGDASEKGKGDIIALTMHLNNYNFADAVQSLVTFSGNSNLLTPPPPPAPAAELKKSQLYIKKVTALQNEGIIKYFEARGIPRVISMSYLNEVHYTNYGKNFVSAGWHNVRGGLELRGLGVFKACHGHKSFTNHDCKRLSLQKLYVFEGYTDFLSALVIKNVLELDGDVIVLNSTKVLNNQLLEHFNMFQTIYCFLDNDPSGRQCHERIQAHCTNAKIVDVSQTLHPNSKDLNEYLCRNLIAPAKP